MPSSTAREQLGARLREYRSAAKLSGMQVADALGCRQAKVSRVEAGKTRITPEELRAWLEATGAPSGVYDELLALVEQGNVELAKWRDLKAKGWEAHQRTYQELEDSATVIKLYQPSLVPGLLQSHGYATHLMRNVVRVGDDQVETAVNARLLRQGLLYKPEKRLDVIVCEHVLRQPFGGHAVMAEQLRHIASLARLPTVDLGVIPTDTGMNEVWDHSYVLHEMPDDDDSVVVVELRGREFRDGGPEALAEYRAAHQTYRDAAVSGEDTIAFVERIAEDHAQAATTEGGV